MVIYMKKNIFGEMIGWYGTIAILGAYVLVSFEIVPGSGLVYQLLNLTGALGLGYVALVKKAYQIVALEVVWVVLAVFIIIRLFIY